MRMPETGTPVCRLDEIPQDNGLERRFPLPGGELSVVIVRDGDSAVAFVNRCPHAGVPLHFSPGVFCLYDSEEGRDLVCPYHSAMFRLPGGHCHSGPCAGDVLIRVPLELRGEMLHIAGSY